MINNLTKGLYPYLIRIVFVTYTFKIIILMSILLFLCYVEAEQDPLHTGPATFFLSL